MNGAEVAIYCVLISIFWGCTNPLIKKATKDISKVQSDNLVNQYLEEIKYLIVNWKYLLLVLINQGGSVIFFIVLQNVELSLIVPTVNTLTFLVTGITGALAGEKRPNFETLAGVVFIVCGIGLCILDKIHI